MNRSKYTVEEAVAILTDDNISANEFEDKFNSFLDTADENVNSDDKQNADSNKGKHLVNTENSMNCSNLDTESENVAQQDIEKDEGNVLIEIYVLDQHVDDENNFSKLDTNDNYLNNHELIEKSPDLDCTLQDFNGQLNNDIISEAEKINENGMQINETDIESQKIRKRVNNQEIGNIYIVVGFLYTTKQKFNYDVCVKKFFILS
jgi:hypothetical protein